MTDEWIYIPNWDGPTGFQHYKDRDPKWIKTYTRLLSHDAYADLTFAQRGILHGIWLEYARSARRLRGDSVTLSRRLGKKVSKKSVTALVNAGFIQIVASDALAARYQDASPETYTQDKEPPASLPAVANYDAEDDLRWATDIDLQRLDPTSLLEQAAGRQEHLQHG